MKSRITRRAYLDIDCIYEDIAELSPAAAERVRNQIFEEIARLP